MSLPDKTNLMSLSGGARREGRRVLLAAVDAAAVDSTREGRSPPLEPPPQPHSGLDEVAREASGR